MANNAPVEPFQSAALLYQGDSLFKRALLRASAGKVFHMFGFFEGFNKGCGCAIGAVVGLVIALIIVRIVFGEFPVSF